MSSGVKVNAECQTAFQQLSEAKKYRYIIYKIVDNEVVVEVALTAEELCPDSASIKKKMVYASTASAIKASLGTAKMLQFQVSDESEIAHKEFLSKLNEKYRDN
uniref:ADF-H domain-containing protein n=1 Tax=Meloidogyne hapla TaxID=6305 RepID=A0A1I8BL56_MELHA